MASNLADSTPTTTTNDYSTNPHNTNTNNKNNDDSNNIQNEIAPVIIIKGDVIFHQLFQVTDLFFLLDLQSILSLALTSKTLFKPLSSLISQHFTFQHKHTPLIHYHPKKLRVQTFDIDGLFDNPNLSSVTEIEFGTNDINWGYPLIVVIQNILLIKPSPTSSHSISLHILSLMVISTSL